MDKPRIYEIRVEGQLTERWCEWFAGLSMHPSADSTTILRGHLPDQSALLGVLNKIHALNLNLISVIISTDQNKLEGLRDCLD